MQLLASAADMNTELPLNEYYPEVVSAIKTIKSEIVNYPQFLPVQRIERTPVEADSMKLAVMLFLISSMGAERNESFQKRYTLEPMGSFMVFPSAAG